MLKTLVDLSALYYAWQDIKRLEPRYSQARLDYGDLVKAAQDKVFGPDHTEPVWGVTTRIRPGAQTSFLQRLNARGWEVCLRNARVSGHSTPVAARLAQVATLHPGERILCISPATHMDEVLSWLQPDRITVAFFADGFETTHPDKLVLNELLSGCTA